MLLTVLGLDCTFLQSLQEPRKKFQTQLPSGDWRVQRLDPFPPV